MEYGLAGPGYCKTAIIVMSIRNLSVKKGPIYKRVDIRVVTLEEPQLERLSWIYDILNYGTPEGQHGALIGGVII